MAASGDGPSPSAPGRGGLTAEERAVLASAATGRGTHEVAEHLGTTPDAVRAAVASARTKLGARSKLEAILIASRAGQLDPPS